MATPVTVVLVTQRRSRIYEFKNVILRVGSLPLLIKEVILLGLMPTSSLFHVKAYFVGSQPCTSIYKSSIIPLVGKRRCNKGECENFLLVSDKNI